MLKYFNYIVEKYKLSIDVKRNLSNYTFYVMKSYLNMPQTDEKFQNILFQPYSHILRIKSEKTLSFLLQTIIIANYDAIVDKSVYDYCDAYKEFLKYDIKNFRFKYLDKIKFCK